MLIELALYNIYIILFYLCLCNNSDIKTLSLSLSLLDDQEFFIYLVPWIRPSLHYNVNYKKVIVVKNRITAQARIEGNF